MSNSERSERPKRKAAEVADEMIHSQYLHYETSRRHLSVIQPITQPRDMNYVNACKKQTDSSDSNGGKHPRGSGYHYERKT